jgi:hypothetical protein
VSHPYRPSPTQCPVCEALCECKHWQEVDIGVGVQTFDYEYFCETHGYFCYTDEGRAIFRNEAISDDSVA